eukprot:gnl/MRDRNA2_/MRDRNA2_113668_c0_seq1.p1 gnl/MRDRNA2_/MRDRNA2_113668_c0~~gnl/MRDRNA2_/MRDRNA2_113668_c0_seq1.p1  ORF type:complete len:158 (-),score=36.12 gnl/MRDRNA2_/MRDRNA2_113668_c0_seq1:50-523(-)
MGQYNCSAYNCTDSSGCQKTCCGASGSEPCELLSGPNIPESPGLTGAEELKSGRHDAERKSVRFDVPDGEEEETTRHPRSDTMKTEAAGASLEEFMDDHPRNRPTHHKEGVTLDEKMEIEAMEKRKADKAAGKGPHWNESSAISNHPNWDHPLYSPK